MNTPPDLVADRYRLVKMLGSGGMGVVWQAWDERLQRTVALKMLRTQPELTDEEREVATKRATREARISAGLHHPHAVPVFDVVEHDGQPCIVMQLIDSTPLSKLLQEHGTFTPLRTARVGAEVGAALAAAHRRKIVHRDVKPGNILIRDDGSAMISDFGIAQALGDTTITATGLVHGTPAYLAPEVARGDPSSFASDVFSLGSTLFAMLEGAPPFGTDRNAIALLHRVAQGEVAVPGSAGPLAPLLLEMLSPDPKQRPDMATVTRRLAELDEQLVTTDATGPAGDDDDDTVPATIPVAGAAAAGGAAAAAGGAAAATAAHESPTVPAETRAIGDTA
jgi:serine/threonine protein kinase